MMIVSHALGTIQELCSDTIWLHHGEVIMRDTPERVTEAYMKFLDVGNVAAVMEDF